MNKDGFFYAGFGAVLRSPLLEWAEKCKFQHDPRKPGVTDPSLSYECSYLRVGKSESKWTDNVVF